MSAADEPLVGAELFPLLGLEPHPDSLFRWHLAGAGAVLAGVVVEPGTDGRWVVLGVLPGGQVCCRLPVRTPRELARALFQAGVAAGAAGLRRRLVANFRAEDLALARHLAGPPPAPAPEPRRE